MHPLARAMFRGSHPYKGFWVQGRLQLLQLAALLRFDLGKLRISGNSGSDLQSSPFSEDPAVEQWDLANLVVDLLVRRSPNYTRST